MAHFQFIQWKQKQPKMSSNYQNIASYKEIRLANRIVTGSSQMATYVQPDTIPLKCAPLLQIWTPSNT